MEEVEKKKDMSREIEKLNEPISHLLLGFGSCYLKIGNSTPTYKTKSWQIKNGEEYT